MANSSDRIIKQAQAELLKRFHRAGQLYVSEARQALNQAQPYSRSRGGKGMKGLRPSRTGQMPKKLRGELQRSMAYQIKGFTLYLGTTLAGHPSWLQFGTRRMGPRPWLTLIYRIIQSRLKAIL